MSIDHINYPSLSGLPQLDEVLADPELTREWGLAKMRSDLARERKNGLVAKKEGDALEYWYVAQETEAELTRFMNDETAVPHITATVGWFDEAQQRLAINELAQHLDDPDEVRRMLARRALWETGFIA